MSRLKKTWGQRSLEAHEIDAYVDGELSPERAKEVSIAAATNLEVSERINMIRSLNMRVRNAFSGRQREMLSTHLQRVLDRYQ